MSLIEIIVSIINQYFDIIFFRYLPTVVLIWDNIISYFYLSSFIIFDMNDICIIQILLNIYLN